MEKKKVVFICVHNSCKSQIAEALGKHLAGDVLVIIDMCVDGVMGEESKN